jgi:hypothetical protein
VLWHPVPDAELEQVLHGHGARPWQIELVSPVLREAATRTAASEAPERDQAAEAASPVEQGV